VQVKNALNWKIFVLLLCDIYNQYQCLRYYRSNTNYAILARDDTFGKAIAKFDKYASQGKQLDAIFITDSGVKTQKILGIVTLSDIPQIIKTLY